MSDEIENLHAAMARSTCGSEHVHPTFGPLLERETLKKRTPLWHHSQNVKSIEKHTTFGPLFEVEMLKNGVVVQSTFRSQNAENTPRSDHFFDVELLNNRKTDRQKDRQTDR